MVFRLPHSSKLTRTELSILEQKYDKIRRANPCNRLQKHLNLTKKANKRYENIQQQFITLRSRKNIKHQYCCLHQFQQKSTQSTLKNQCSQNKRDQKYQRYFLGSHEWKVLSSPFSCLRRLRQNILNQHQRSSKRSP